MNSSAASDVYKRQILASRVVLAIGVENKPQMLGSPRHIQPLNVKNAVLAIVFKQQMHQLFQRRPQVATKRSLL